nr:MAG TPA: hydrogenase-1 expression protein [Caudoviricetes sp.]
MSLFIFITYWHNCPTCAIINRQLMHGGELA